MDEKFLRVVTVAYKLSGYFPEGDPLKTKAKEIILKILENLSLVSDADGWVSLQKERASGEILDNIELLENYFKIAKYQNWIDSVNFLIIIKELDSIKSYIQPPKGSVKQVLEIAAKTPELPKAPKEKKLSLDSKETSTVLSKDLSIRQKKIIEILNQRKKVQVSDIIKEIPDITKRTIRRDLDDLLKKGRILRIGEWNQVFYEIN